MLPTVVDEVLRRQQIKEIHAQLDMEEAVRMAITGTVVAMLAKNGGALISDARSWRRGLIRRRDKLARVSRETFWDKLRRGKSRKI